MRHLVLLCVLAAASPTAAQFTSVRVQVVDVGNADGILIRTPNQRWVLIDAGQDDRFADSLPTHFGVDRIALAIGSHRHYDHVGGLDRVLDLLPVERLLLDTTAVADRAFDDSVRVRIGRTGTPVIDDGPRADTIDVDGVRFIVLPEGPEQGFSDENDNSVVVRLEFGEFSMLFSGDAEEERRDWLAENVPALLDVDVLKASHHGSHNGTDSTWLALTSPDHVVISAGVRADYRHPHQEAVAAYEAATGGRVFCTNRHGSLRVYGTATGAVRIYRQRPTDKRCAYDGTWY